MSIEIITSLITTVVALVGSSLALIEYRKQGKNRQIDTLIALRTTFEEVSRRHDLLTRLANDDPSLSTMSFADRAEILGLLEMVAAALRSKSLDLTHVHNFFGYYAIRIAASEHFLEGIPKDSIYWKEFSAFAERMKAVEANLISKA